jgi:molybdenum cofactor biosynthesis enzyme MoaA
MYLREGRFLNMKMTITNKNDYISHCEVHQLPITDDREIKQYNLFDEQILVYDDKWMHHLHIKITDICNAKCAFCVEQNCKKDEQPQKALSNIDKMICEMKKQGLLYSVSVTGGEPTVFPYFSELCEILNKYDIPFVTMNTNGHFIDKYLSLIDKTFDFINISRHSCYDNNNDEIFKTKVKTIEELKRIKEKMKHCKMRIQCVIGNELNSIQDIENFMNTYSFADDFSFRRLMELNEEFGVDYNINHSNYFSILDYAFKNWTFKEQTIQDYYIYEIYNNGKTDITFSYSDMNLTRTLEKREKDNFFREFICHPNGVVSGSWKKDCKIILK